MLLGVAVALCVALFVQTVTAKADPRFTKDVMEGRDDAHAPSFIITDYIYLVYKDNTERDNGMASVKLLYQNALSDYQMLAQKLKVTFVKGTPVKGAVANQYAVTFKLDGASRLPLDEMKARTSFHDTIEAMGHPSPANDPKWKTGGSGGGGGSGAVASKKTTSFTITSLTITITYSSTSQRQDYLNQLLVLWKSALSTYSVSNVKITFVSEKLDSSIKQGGSKWYIITYTISGDSSTEVDQEAAKASFQQLLITKHFSWVFIVGGGGDSGSGSGGKKGSTSFTITSLTITITYSSTSQRQDYLNQLLVLWKSALSKYTVTNVKITFVNEKPDSSITQDGKKWYIITYTISGDSSTPVDQKEAKDSFQTILISKKFTWTFTVSGSGKKDGNGGGSSGGGGSLVTDSVVLSYKSTAERDKILQQMLAVWKQVLSIYGISNLQIVFDKETSQGSGSSKSYIVVYHLTGSGGKSFNQKDVTSSFKTKLTSAHVSGVISVTVTMSSSGSLSASDLAALGISSGSGTVSGTWKMEASQTVVSSKSSKTG